MKYFFFRRHKMTASLHLLISLGNSIPSQQTPVSTPIFLNLDKKLCCLICKEVLRNAVQTLCGHRMCLSCLENYLRPLNGITPRCPADEDSCCDLKLEEIHRDSSARREVRLLTVYCTFRDGQNGCQETMSWKDLETHVENCVFRITECPSKAYGCIVTFPFKDLSKHEIDCLFRRVKCTFCEEVITLNLQGEHEKQNCRRFIIQCPYKCGAPEAAREQMEQHMFVCENRPKNCKFQAVGCDFVGPPPNVKTHEEQNVHEHLQMVTLFTARVDLDNLHLKQNLQSMASMQENTSETVSLIQNKIDVIRTSVDQMKDSLRDLKRKIVVQTERVIHAERKIEDSARKDILERQQRDIVALQEGQSQINEKFNRLQRSGPLGGETGGATADHVMTQIQQHGLQLGMQDVRLAELDLRFQVLETASYDGILMWKIRDYTRRKQDAINGRTVSLYSQPFYTGRFGYKMCARVYLNGDGMGKGTHMSLFFVVMRGDYDPLLRWPFKQKVSLILLDQDTGTRHLTDTFSPDATSSSFKRPTSEMNIASGCPLFVSHSVLETRTYLKDDTLFIKIAVDTQGVEQF